MSNNEPKKEKTNGKRICVFIAIIILIILVAIAIYIKENNKDYEIEEVTSFSYFKIYENEKYGIIDVNGNILIEAKYDNIDIPNPSKPVFIVYSNYDSQKGEYESQVINDKNEKILTQYEKVLPLMFKESTSEVPYEKSILLYKENDKYGIIDFQGKKITKAIYDSMESLLYKEGCILVSKEDKYGVINIKGKEMIKIEYDSITADGYYQQDSKYKNAGFIVGNKKEEGYRYGYINYKADMILKVEYNEIDRITEIANEDEVYLLAFKNGQAGIYKNKEQLLKHKYEEIEYNEQNELFIVQKSEKQGVINSKGNQILDVKYDYVMISGNKINAEIDGMLYIFDINGNTEKTEDSITILATENEKYFITINKDELYGVIDKDGNIVLQNEYQYVEYAFEDYFIVTKDSKIGVVDKDNIQKLDFKYSIIEKIKNTNVLQAIEESTNIIELYNNKVQKVASMENVVITVENNYIKLSSDKERMYLDKNGNQVENTQLFTDLSLFAYNENGKWGFKDNKGNIKTAPIYDMVTELNSYGFAGIKQNGKWGVINKDAVVIVEPSYIIEWQEPEFIGPYAKLNFGYELVYYTKQLTGK